MRMTDAIAHRGPDGEGFWINQETGIGLGHRRLSIIDLSAAAAQPMHYLHYSVVFNGEIYNYRELKEVLVQKGYYFNTQSDTEVIMAAFDCWGPACLQQFDGMFAFALWNNKDQQLLIARDRFGEKPLYYHADYLFRGKFEQFVFASEIKALWAAGIKKELNGTMMLNYLTLGYLQNPLKKTETFFSNILSLPPGYYLTVQPREARVQMKRWYHPQKAILQVQVKDKEADIIEQFCHLLQTSVIRRLRSDVPVGSSLSGGLDSSAIVASICQTINGKPLHTFSAVFPGFEKDESIYVDQIAAAFPVVSHAVTPGVEDFEQYWHRFSSQQEEPLQSSSAFTQYMVYKLAAQNKVTVLLDGQGADEVLGGYTKYTQWYLQQLSRTSRQQLAKERSLLQQNGFLDNWGWRNYAAAIFPEKTASLLQSRAMQQQTRHRFISKDFIGRYQNTGTLQKPVIKHLEDMLYYNTFHVGLEELLRYADRNSMVHSREVRLPFLYHELVEFVFALPAGYKIRDGFTKWILRKSVEPSLPATIAWRKGKTGYEPPQQQWMKSPVLQSMINEARKKLVSAGVLEGAVMQHPIIPAAAHSRGNFDWRCLSAAAIL